MRSVSSALQSKLDSGVTTLAQCWVVRRRDGAVFGPDSECFDPDRERLAEHVAFGFGIHHCIDFGSL